LVDHKKVFAEQFLCQSGNFVIDRKKACRSTVLGQAG
jgi:hypothetical protein